MVRRRVAPLYISLFQAFVVVASVVVGNAFYLEPEKLEVAIDVAREVLTRARNWAKESYELLEKEKDDVAVCAGLALTDCVKLYEDSERRLLQPATVGPDDALTWLSAAMTCHQTCTEELQRWNVTVPAAVGDRATAVLRQVLSTHALHVPAGHQKGTALSQRNCTTDVGALLASWDYAENKADIVVAKDGSGNYNTINAAVTALGRLRRRQRSGRLVVYVKSGTYKEYVEVNTHNIMFVGDGIDRTVVTGYRSVPDGYTTFSSATFRVTGDGFWARDMTFENTAGPAKHQAVAMTVASDRSVFYRCCFRGYQDTLFLHSLRHFYRDCQVHGTVDFIFGNAAAVLQNCDIFVRRPMAHQANMVTAQGRDDPNQNTGIAIHASRVRAAKDFERAKWGFRSYLGRPWKRYSRTVFLKADLDGLVDPEGWARWDGDFALATLFYGEYKNTGEGAQAGRRVKWPGFHVLREDGEAAPFTVERFIQGQPWIAAAGVPFWRGLKSY